MFRLMGTLMGGTLVHPQQLHIFSPITTFPLYRLRHHYLLRTCCIELNSLKNNIFRFIGYLWIRRTVLFAWLTEYILGYTSSSLGLCNVTRTGYVGTLKMAEHGTFAGVNISRGLPILRDPIGKGRRAISNRFCDRENTCDTWRRMCCCVYFWNAWNICRKISMNTLYMQFRYRDRQTMKPLVLVIVLVLKAKFIFEI